MEKNKISKTGKALLFITSGLLLSDACFGIRHSIFSPDEDARLMAHVKEHGPKKWTVAAAQLPGKTRKQCRQRWTRVLALGIKKGTWSAEEDNQLKRLVATHGVGKWAIIAKQMIPGRTARQCRERWILALDPTINKGPWEPAEDKILIEGVEAKHGWTAIARELGLDKTGKHRTGLQCQNRWWVLKDRAQQPPAQADQAPANPPPQSPPTPLPFELSPLPFSNLPSLELSPLPSLDFDDELKIHRPNNNDFNGGFGFGLDLDGNF